MHTTQHSDIVQRTDLAVRFDSGLGVYALEDATSRFFYEKSRKKKQNQRDSLVVLFCRAKSYCMLLVQTLTAHKSELTPNPYKSECNELIRSAFLVT